MDLPWSAAGTPSAGQDAYVMASRFELTSIWRSPAFLTQAVRAWRQARRSPGVYGVTLRAELLQRRYWTAPSIWCTLADSSSTTARIFLIAATGT